MLCYYDDTFIPKLSLRVSNLEEYAVKLCTYANVYAISKNTNNNSNLPIGFIAYYSNDVENKIAYLTQLVVDIDYQKSGVGAILMEFFISNVKNEGFTQIKLEVNKQNSHAIKFYKNYDFYIEREASFSSWYMKKEL